MKPEPIAWLMAESQSIVFIEFIMEFMMEFMMEYERSHRCVRHFGGREKDTLIENAYHIFRHISAEWQWLVKRFNTRWCSGG